MVTKVIIVLLSIIIAMVTVYYPHRAACQEWATFVYLYRGSATRHRCFIPCF